MNDVIPTTLVEETKKALAPAQELNRLVVDNAEKLIALQLASAQSYAALGLGHLRAALEVNDEEALKTYIAKHSELVKTVSEKLADDAKAVTELGSAFSARALEIGQESVKVVTKKAA